MADIHHRLAMCAPREEVFTAVTNEVLAGAFSQGVLACVVIFDRDESVANVWRSSSATTGIRPRIPNGSHSASLRVVDGPMGWIGTEIVIELGASENSNAAKANAAVVVKLTHKNWRDLDEMASNTTRWGRVLLGLKRRVETPEPNDTQV